MFSVTVNVSGRQLQQAGFVADVEAALAATGFPAARFVLELTESTVIYHPEVARQRLNALGDALDLRTVAEGVESAELDEDALSAATR